MKQQATNNTIPNSKGASIFKKIIEDKKAIHEHIRKGGNISEIKAKFRFAKPISVTGK
jgi:hypothetical protein